MVSPAEAKIARIGGKRSLKKRADKFDSYIIKVLRQVHNDLTITKKSMAIMNSFVLDTFEKVCTEASRLMRMSSKETMGVKDVECAVSLLLPPVLAKHAVDEGHKACDNFGQN